MKNTYTNNMQVFRKRNHVTLEDLAFLLGLDAYNLSRYEQSKRAPTLDTILTYHALFDANIAELFAEQYHQLMDSLNIRIKELIQKLHRQQPPRFAQRIAKLGLLMNRLTPKNHE